MTVTRKHLWVAAAVGPDGRQWDAVVPAGDREEAREGARRQAAWALSVQAGSSQLDAGYVDVHELVQVADDQAQVYEVSWQARIATAAEVVEHQQWRRELIDQIDPLDRVDVGMDLSEQFGIPEPIVEFEPDDDMVWARSESEAVRLVTAGMGSADERWADLRFGHVSPLGSYAALLEVLQRQQGQQEPTIEGMQARLVASMEASGHTLERLEALPEEQVQRLQSLSMQLAEVTVLSEQAQRSGPAYFRQAVGEMNAQRRQSLESAIRRTAGEIEGASGRPAGETARLTEAFSAELGFELDESEYLLDSIADRAVDEPPQWIAERLGQVPAGDEAAERWQSAVRTAVKAQLMVDPGAPLDQGLPDHPTAEQQPHVDRALQALEPVAELPVVDLGR